MDTDNSALMLFLAFVFVFLNAFFVLSEFAIVKIRKSKLEELVRDKVPNAKIAYKISNSLDTYLSATQLGITLSSLALGWIGEPAVAKFIEYPIEKIMGENDILVHTVSFAISFGFITLLHVVLGELVPKSIAIVKPEKATLLIAKPLHVFWVIFSPFIKIFDFLARSVLKMFNMKPAGESEIAHSEEEIKIIVAESLKGGVLDSVESEIIKNAVDFGETVAKEIMTPRKNMICLNKQKSYDENYKTVIEARYTRFPYIDGSKDNVLGMVHIRDIMQQGNNKDFNKIVRKLIIVPENSSIAKILPMMNKEGLSAALVIDEYGGTAGFLTMEDIIEEIFGDINDEHDDKSPDYKKLQDNVYEFIGRFDLEDVEEIMDIKFDEETEEFTIGGYVFNLLGRLPVAGDKIEDEICKYEVIKMDGNTIEKVKVYKKITDEDDEE